MFNQPDGLNPIQPHHSFAHVAEPFVAMIERSSFVAPLGVWEENKPYFLREDMEAICEEFREEIEAAFAHSQTAMGASHNQASLGRQIAQDALARAENKPASQQTLNTVRVIAIERYRDWRDRSRGPLDDTG